MSETRATQRNFAKCCQEESMGDVAGKRGEGQGNNVPVRQKVNQRSKITEGAEGEGSKCETQS